MNNNSGQPRLSGHHLYVTVILTYSREVFEHQWFLVWYIARFFSTAQTLDLLSASSYWYSFEYSHALVWTWSLWAFLNSFSTCRSAFGLSLASCNQHKTRSWIDSTRKGLVRRKPVSLLLQESSQLDQPWSCSNTEGTGTYPASNQVDPDYTYTTKRLKINKYGDQLRRQ